MRVGRLCALILVVLATGCGEPGTLPQDDDRAEAEHGLGVAAPGIAPVPQVARYPELGLQLAPILASIENARPLLRQDSGTVAADSAFIRFRRELRDRFTELVAAFDDPEFQADVWPAGAAAMARWREDQRPERGPTPAEVARADSIVAVLTAHGVHVQRAEGDTYFSVAEAEVLDRLGPYLTPGLRDFLGMEVAEQREPAAEDAGLMIPLDELTRRIRRAESSLEAHPASVVADVLEWRFRQYLAFYLAGLPNTPMFDGRTRELEPEWRESMERYATNHAGTGSGALVARYLNMLEASGFRRSAEIDAFHSGLWADVRLVPFPWDRTVS